MKIKKKIIHDEADPAAWYHRYYMLSYYVIIFNESRIEEENSSILKFD